MKSDAKIRRDARDTEERLKYLEEVNRFTMEALDIAASIGNFQASINKLHDPSLILEEAIERIHRLVPFQCTAFFLVDEVSSDFILFECKPQDQSQWVQEEMENLIEDGSFGRALRANKPLRFFSKDNNRHLLLHVMATTSRVRGMFVGIPSQKVEAIPDISQGLLSIVIQGTANALESFELYKRIREFNAALKDKVHRLSLSEHEMMTHRSDLELLIQERTAQLQATVLKLNEEIAERKRIQADLQKSRKLLRNFFNSIPDSLVEQNEELRIAMQDFSSQELESETIEEES